MAYYNEDQLYRLFDKAISAKAQERKEKLRSEIGYAYAKQMKKVRADISLDSTLEYNRGLRELRLNYQDRINKIGVGYDEALIKERNRMIDYVFNGVNEKLQSFIKSSKYKTYIESKIKNVNKVIGKSNSIFKIASHDQMIKDILKQNVQAKHTIEIDPNIKFGGFIVVLPKENLEINQTIDVNLESQKKWFYKNSKLFIRD